MHRRPSSSSPKPSKKQNRASGSKSASMHIAEPSIYKSDWEEEESNAEELSDSQNHSHGLSSDSGFEDDDDAVDAPRVAQWEDDEDFEEEIAGDSQTLSGIYTLQNDLLGLPLGALRKAQRVLAQATVDSDDSDGAQSGEEPEGLQHKHATAKKMNVKPEWSLKPRPGIAKRSNKNAPIEVTSKRPVTRKRTVVEVKQVQTRDPRFLSLAGEFSEDKFQQQYGFLADSHWMELKTLRENLKRARKLIASSPQDLLSEREKEVNRLELAVKRAESLVNKDKRDKVEREALGKVTQEEKDKRKHGKAGWWLKESEKRELLVRARYDALAAEGGKRAVKKAIEKKQKKLGQKEKKSRPFPKRGSDGSQPRRKRDSTSGGGEDEQPVKKRPRVG